MNLSSLFQLIPARIDYMSFNDYKNKPIVKVYDNNQKKEIVFRNLFNDTKYILNDFRTLAMIWDDLLPDREKSLESKHEEILHWLGGKRYAYDIFEIIKWLQTECDIDTAMILNEIESSKHRKE